MFGTCFYLPLSSSSKPASPTNGIVKQKIIMIINYRINGYIFVSFFKTESLKIMSIYF